jgi:uncharacterized protein (TIGR03067 family)
MKTMLSLAALTTFACVSVVQSAQPAREDVNISGSYIMVGGEKSGTEIPADRIDGIRVVFTGDRIITSDKDENETYAATYVLDTTKKPFGILMTSVKPQAGETAMGLIKQEGEKLFLIYSLPGGDRPTDFKTKDKQHLFILEKAK